MRSGPSVNARVGFRLRRRVGHGKTKRVNDEPLMAYVALGANLGAAAGTLREAADSIAGWSSAKLFGSRLNRRMVVRQAVWLVALADRAGRLPARLAAVPQRCAWPAANARHHARVAARRIAGTRGPVGPHALRIGQCATRHRPRPDRLRHRDTHHADIGFAASACPRARLRLGPTRRDCPRLGFARSETNGFRVIGNAWPIGSDKNGASPHLNVEGAKTRRTAEMKVGTAVPAVRNV